RPTETPTGPGRVPPAHSAAQTALNKTPPPPAPATTTTEPATTTTSATTSTSPPPAQVTVLDYTNWLETDAVASLAGAGLVPSVVYQPSTDCLVIGQSVPAGTAVDPGTAVELTVGTAEACATP